MNKREAIQAMLNGEKINRPDGGWPEIIYWIDERGDFHSTNGSTWTNSITDYGWEIYKPEPKFKVGEFVQSKNGDYYRIHRIKTQNGKYHYELACNIKDTGPLFLFEENVKKLEEIKND